MPKVKTSPEEQKKPKYSIYSIKNKQTGLIYIGQTVRTPIKRWEQHKTQAGLGISNALIHRAMRAIGIDQFEFSVICETEDLTELDMLEMKHIQDANSLHPNGYNMTAGGRSGKRVKSLRDNRLDLNKLYDKDAFLKLLKICRQNGILKMELGDSIKIELSPNALFPESNYKKKQKDSKEDIQTETYTEEEALFWSSAGIPEETAAH